MYGIDPAGKSHDQFSRGIQIAALGELLTDDQINVICRQLGHTWRERTFPPGVTVRSMVYRRLHPDKSIRAMLADLAAGTDRIERIPADTSWCEARSRLPEGLWDHLIDHSARRLEEMTDRRGLYCRREVYIVDGSTVSMPDTPGLVDAFGYADTRHGPSRFPVARITFITHAGSQAVVDYRLDPYRTAEDAQFHAMWGRMPDGCICLADRKFGSFYTLAKLHQRGIDMICPLHQRRDPNKLIAAGAKIGPNDWGVWFELAPQLRQKYADPSLPKRLGVRLIRVRFRRNGKAKVLWLTTTLRDPQRYSRGSIVALYRTRWGIETRIGSLKTTLEMNVLPSKTDTGVRTDVAATILAHNLVWTVIHQAAGQTHTAAGRISFAGAIQTILAYSTTLRHASATTRRDIYYQMLANIGRQTNPHRPGRIEPRLIKRQRKRYGFLKLSRQEARKDA